MGINNKLRFQCIHCGQCCLDQNTLVNTTYIDVLRIRNGLNLTIDEVIEILGFYVFDQAPSVNEISRMVVPPIQTEQGMAFVGLKKKPNGQCFFYDIVKERCSIYAFRPGFCRTFPFTFTILKDKNKKKSEISIFYTNKGIQYCRGIGEEYPFIDLEQWINLGREVIRDLSKNNQLTKKWNSSVKNKRISPSARNYVLTIFNLE
ncbi:MAG: YkgJ family cysteine cluster protein [Candidatus Lokiarchaeota archaeon]|nr:YkgJ family cysteine cluster protein [Candidatus Lokiarchaeota archaeon]